MKLHLTSSDNQNLITGYGQDDDVQFIEINKQKYRHPLIVTAKQLILDWSATDFASLSAIHFEVLIQLKPEVVLLGVGEKHQFLHPKIAQKLAENNIPLECMTTAAACRTYNFLMSEGRNVAAALIF